MNFFFIFATVTLVVLHGVVGVRIIPFLNLNQNLKIFAWCLIVILGALPIIPIILRSKGYEKEFVDYFSWAGYISLGFFVLTFLAVITKDLIYFLVGFASKISSEYSSETISFERREFIQKLLSIGIITTTGTSTIKGLYNARKGPTIMKENVPINKLHKDMINLTIAQISDLHVGPTIKKGYVENVVNEVNKLNPDIIAITGDMVDGSVNYLAKHVEPLKDLHANIGKFFVTGNHEHYIKNSKLFLSQLENYNINGIIIIVTHGIFSNNALDRLSNCKSILKIITSDSINQEKNLLKYPKLEVFTISEMMADTIRNINSGESLSKLFNI